MTVNALKAAFIVPYVDIQALTAPLNGRARLSTSKSQLTFCRGTVQVVKSLDGILERNLKVKAVAAGGSAARRR